MHGAFWSLLVSLSIHSFASPYFNMSQFFLTLGLLLGHFYKDLNNFLDHERNS